MKHDEIFLDYFKKTHDVEGDIIEIGTADGNSAKVILDNMNGNKWFFTVDPYGNKPYKQANEMTTRYNYNDELYRKTIAELYQRACDKNYTHWKIESLDFMKYYPKISFWSNGRKRKPIFSFIYLDGDHDTETVKKEFEWAIQHLSTGGVVAVDDYNCLGNSAEVRELFAPYELDLYDIKEHKRFFYTK